MTTIALPRAIERPTTQTGSRAGWVLSDILVLTWRNLIALTRTPQNVFFSAVQPIMFTLLFVYVFGGAIHTSVPYVDYLMPGIYVQTVAFGAVATAVGLSEDLHKGLI
ncbi:MAG TPA: ABC transporter permease, partial [Acidimicrobiales bacterium]